MKKILFFFFLFLIIIIFIPTEKEAHEELRGIYFSYIEISKYLKDKDEATSKKNIKEIIENIKNMNLNTIVIQVRPSNDAIYYSKIFPISKYLSDNNTYPYDVLDYIIEESHKKNIKVYAWLNPYRISTKPDISEITENNPAYKYLNTDTIYINNGIYFNPSKKEVNEIIIKGIEEVTKYDVDAILFDDYFYPNDEIDIADYNKTSKDKSLEEYHLNIVNNLIEQVHSTCKKYNKPFGIAPEGNIENNYHNNYADVKRWLNNEKYIDFIAPQIYYGFNNSNKPFANTLNEWTNINKKNIDFYVSLAFYKVGKEDNYAQLGKNEWLENDNIIMKEIIYSRTVKGYKGFILYRYDNVFNEENYTNTSKNEVNNIKKILK